MTSEIYSGRAIPLLWRVAATLHRPLQRAAIILLPSLCLLLLTTACDIVPQYTAVKDAANNVGVGISGTYRLPPFPTPPAATTPVLPIPAVYTPVEQTTPFPGSPPDPCAGVEWWQKNIYQAASGGIKNFTRTIFLGGIVLFASSASTTDAPVEDGAVIWVAHILADMVQSVWPLALLWSLLKKTGGSILGEGEGSSVGQTLVRIFVAAILVSAPTPTSPLVISYIMAIPLLISNSVFRFLIGAATSGWTNLTAFGGIFNTNGACNGISLIPLALMAILIALILVAIAAIFTIRTAMLYIYFASAPAVVAAGLFDETRFYQLEFVQNFLKLVFGVFPTGIIFLLMNAFIFAPSEDTTLSATRLGLAIACIFLMFLTLKSSLSGATMQVWSKLLSTGRNNRTLAYGTAKAAGGLVVLSAPVAALGGMMVANAIGGPVAGGIAAAGGGAASRYLWRTAQGPNSGR